MKSLKSFALALGLSVGSLGALGGTTGCTTDAFCFENCDGSGIDDDGGLRDGDTQDVDPLFDALPDTGECIGIFCDPRDAGDGGDCVPTNEGVEICDNQDNDCDGKIDEPGQTRVVSPDETPTPDTEDIYGVDYTRARTCGQCGNDCSLLVEAVSEPTCVPPDDANLGLQPGTCDFTECAADFWDVDGDRTNGCEYFRPFNPDGTNTTDPGGTDACNRDDDCDGEVDEDVDVCDDTENCGRCGKRCVIPNGTASCVTSADTAGGEACTEANTGCEVAACNPGFFDVDGSPDNGCEYECVNETPEPEVCDGVDNDCDGRIDNEDPDLLMGEATIGTDCFGGTQGVCSAQANAGVFKCIASALVCCDVDSGNTGDDLRNKECDGTVGPFVLRPGDLQETCNGLDDDCDGAVDDSPVDAGAACGNNVGECTLGTELCVDDGNGNKVIECRNNVDPEAELCDGLDNDCDGVIDGTISASPTSCTSDADCTTGIYISCLPRNGNLSDTVCAALPTDLADPTTGARLSCTSNNPFGLGTFPAPPAGATNGSPCVEGQAACIGGAPRCQGVIEPQQNTDSCFEDTNCDGQLTNQTGLTNNDPQNCGDCGNDCDALGPGVLWTCNGGVCDRTGGCAPNKIDCDSGDPGGDGSSIPDDNDCETDCTFRSNQELCNNVDDDCDCFVDAADPQGVALATPIQACGVNPSATENGCTSGITVACVNGGFECTFPPGYCGNGGDCSLTPDVCDGLDNDCDGTADEAFKPPALNNGFLGQVCFSGQGPCENSGAFVCNSAMDATECNATPLNNSGPEVCNGVDDDCDGLIDNADPDLVTDDPNVNQPCQKDPDGICGLSANFGTNACVGGVIVCQGGVDEGDQPEICDGVDNDCDGQVDEAGPAPGGINGTANPNNALQRIGGPCGDGTGACQQGSFICNASGQFECTGEVGPSPEVCDGVDNDCTGTADDNLTGLGACYTGSPTNATADGPPALTPNAACPGATQPCSAGTESCSSGAIACNGETTPVAGATDACCQDTNCDGVLDNVPDFQNDPNNCNGCGNVCGTPGDHIVWGCVSGGCTPLSCETGFIDCDGGGASTPNDGDCETACSFNSATEQCNGVDDNCNCQTDTDIDPANIPSTVQVCGVAPAASDPNCIETQNGGNVVVSCQAGAWNCAFQPNYCDVGSPADCATTPDTCDGADNNCNGTADENFKAPTKSTGGLGTACASDDGLPPPGHGQCRDTGVFVCNIAGDDTECSATIDLTAATAETCDGVDNDCDSSVDETYLSPGTSASYIQPDVVQVGASLWMYQYEASRPNATSGSPGSGNGYHTSAPAGVTLDATISCSEAGDIPWFNVTPDEADQTCTAVGGRLCSLTEWTSMCEATASCDFGYVPQPGNCTTVGNYPTGPDRLCNIGPYDFNTSLTGIQNGLLPTAYMGGDPNRPALLNCGSDWGGQFSQAAGTTVFDTMGNLREITESGGNFVLMGGAFNTQNEDPPGADTVCDFDFFTVDSSFQFFDTGFRCCFDADPT